MSKDIMSEDEINEPSHYKLFGDTEVFDVILSALTADEYLGYLKGNVLKYRLRAGKKGDAKKCIAKADVYEEKARKLIEIINMVRGESSSESSSGD